MVVEAASIRIYVLKWRRYVRMSFFSQYKELTSKSDLLVMLAVRVACKGETLTKRTHLRAFMLYPTWLQKRW